MKTIISIFFTLSVLYSCQSESSLGNISPSLNDSLDVWSIPKAEVRDGGVGKDGIPAIDTPTRIQGSQATFMNDDDLILGIKYKNTVVAYPHKILNYHEIVNDKIDDFAFSISFCPLTGTGVCYNRSLNNAVTTYGVSGLLYNSNLILYDRGSDSYWAQMMLKSVHGENREKENEFYPLIETTWATWKKWYPDTEVLGIPGNPSSAPNYNRYPYGDYRTNNNYLLFSVPTKLKNIPQKERILGIKIGEEVSHTRFKFFSDLNSVLRREFKGENLLIFGSADDNYMFTYIAETEGGEAVDMKNNLIGLERGGLFEDSEGNKWDVFGKAYEGPKKGQSLQKPINYIGYAFAWSAFYPDYFLTE